MAELLLKGAPVAKARTAQLLPRVAALQEQGVTPALALLRLGGRPDDLSYETGIRKRCAKAGIAIRPFLLPADADRATVLETVREINEDRTIHGCLLFRPLPDRETEKAVCELLDPAKDVDGMTAGSLASVFTGTGAGYPPCTARACLEILDFYGVDLTGKRVTVVGRSLVIGRPVSMLLQSRNATVTMCHSRTADLPGECRRADILVVAAGKAGIIGREHVREGQTVIDVGIHTGADGTLCGDVDFAAAEPVVQAITPVPGGVGAVTTAVLAGHVTESARRTLSGGC